MKLNYLLLFLFVNFSASEAQEIKFITHSVENETFINDQGHLRGRPHAGKRAFNVELVTRLKQGTPHEDTHIQVYPLKRAIQAVMKKGNTATFNVSRMPFHEGLMKWVGPMQTDKVYFYRLKSTTAKPSSLEDIKNNAITCVKNGNHHHKHLSSISFKNLEVVNQYSHCFQMLAVGRVDFAVLSTLHLDSVMEVAQLQKSQFEEALLYKQVDGYIAFSLNIRDEVITNWQNKLDRLKKDGTYQALRDKYLYPLVQK